MERFIHSLKEECLNRKIFFTEKSLHTALVVYLSHYHKERNHQGLDSLLIEQASKLGVLLERINAETVWMECSVITIEKPPNCDTYAAVAWFS